MDGNKNGAMQVPVAGGLVAYVDHEDFADVSAHSWSVANVGSKARARARICGRKVYLHRFVMLAPVGVVVDHIDGDPFNCTKSNLRYCASSQNAKNRRPNRGCSSKFKGVRWHKASGKWSASIKSDGRQCWIGLFVNESDAAAAYDVAASKMHGAFAKTNSEIFNER